jgi:arabinosyltransferase
VIILLLSIAAALLHLHVGARLSTLIAGAPPPPEPLELPPALEATRGADVAMLSFTSSPYLHWAFNWAAFCEHLGVPCVVLALDAPAVAALRARGLQFLHIVDASARNSVPADASVREDPQGFRRLGHAKVSTAAELWRRLGWQALVLTDADTAWLRPPQELLAAFPTADLLVSTDCLSATAAAAKNASEHVPRCEMLPGGVTSAWNSGVVVLRRTAAAIALLDEWAARLAPTAPMRSAGEGWWIDDQLALSGLLDEGALPYVAHPAAPPGAGVLAAWSGRVAVAPLPPLLVANGHVAFEQRLPEATQIVPVAVHNTFQVQQADAGKVARMREAGLWLLDPPEHYNPPGGFVTYSSLVPQLLEFWADAWAVVTGRPMTALHRHLLAGAAQLQLLAEALAAARALKRVLVPPRFTCGCWQEPSGWTSMLHTCAPEGVDVPPPSNCSASFYLMVYGDNMDAWLQVARFPNFLQHAAARGSAMARHMLPVRLEHGAARSPALSLGGVGVAVGGGPPRAPWSALPLHPDDADLARLGADAAAAGAGTLDLGPLAPGWLAGMRSASDLAAVADLFYNLTATSGWCCLLDELPGVDSSSSGSSGSRHTQRQDMLHAFAGYLPLASLRALPADGSSDAASARPQWRPPDALWSRPAWCDPLAGYLAPHNLHVVARQQHPCTYLAGTTHTEQLARDVDAALAQVHVMRAWHQQAAAVTDAVGAGLIAGA